MTRWRVILAVGVLCGTIAACSDDGGSKAVGDTGATTTAAPVPTDSEPVDSAPATDAPTTTAAPILWDTVTAASDCMCSDGSGFSYFVRRASPTKVMFFLEGGGACFSAETCDPASSTYKREVGTTDDLDSGGRDGIFDFANPKNPFADYSIVYVPYCTGDVHLGNSTHDYGNGIVVEHKGYVNGTTALATLAELFPDAEEVFVTGESAGSVPTPLYAGLAHDLLPHARITVLADGSGAYPDLPAINELIGGAWGTMNAIPDWPENADVTAATWSFPGLFIKAGKHDPAITFARHDYAFDETQTFFAGLAGIPVDNLVSLIDQNETQVEAGGVPLFSYITAGSSHTVLGSPKFYTETVNGTPFVDWVTALVAGDPVEDVHCTECTVAG